MTENWLQKFDELLSSGQQEAAESFLLARLTTLEELSQVNTGHYLSILNELGSFYRGASRYQESEQAFVRVQKALEESGQALTLPYATLQINLAGTYRLMGDIQKALERYASARSILASLAEHSSADSAEWERIRYLTASVLNNISLLYCDTQESEMALLYAEQAAELLHAGVGDDHELATSYNNLANIYAKLGRADDAEGACQKALAIYERMPRENVHHAAALATFANLRFAKGDFLQAETALKRALELTEHFFGHNVEYEAIQRSLTQVRKAMGERQADV